MDQSFMKFLHIPATSHEFELRFLFKGKNYIGLVEIKARCIYVDVCKTK